MTYFLRKTSLFVLCLVTVGAISVTLVLAQNNEDVPTTLPQGFSLQQSVPGEAAPGVVLVHMQATDTTAAQIDEISLLSPEIRSAQPLFDGSRFDGSAPMPAMFVLEVDAGKEAAVAAALQADPRVRFAEPDYFFYSTTIPNDPFYDQFQWNLRNIHAEAAWERTTGSGEVIIAVIDTGVDLTHPDLVGKVTAGYDYVNDDDDPSDDVGHGTHVASIAAASSNNGEGITGVAWMAQIMPIKALDQDGRGAASDVAQGIVWATNHGADVINLSLGTSQYSETINLAVQYAHERGVLVVAAAGNYYQTGNPIVYPAALNHVFTVAAVNDVDLHASYSSSGSYIDIAAPGGDPSGELDQNPRHWIPGAYWRGQGMSYAWLTGTSQAAPHVAGVAALLLALDPELTPDQLVSIITHSAVDVESTGWDEFSGHGRVDASAAVNLLVNLPPTATPSPTPTDTSTPEVMPTSTPSVIGHTNEEMRVNSTIFNAQSNAAIAADRQGNLNVLWRDKRNDEDQVYSAQLVVSGNGWGPNFIVGGSTQAAGSQIVSPPAIVIDPQNNVHAVWLSIDEEGVGSLHSATQPVGTYGWQGLVSIETGLTPQIERRPALALAADGALFAAWVALPSSSAEESTSQILWSRRAPATATWSTPELLNGVDEAQTEVVLAAGADSVIAAWVGHVQGTATLRMAALDTATLSWSVPTTVIALNPAVADHTPDLAITPSGQMFLAWVDLWTEEMGQDLFVSNRAVDQPFWSTPIPIDDHHAAAQQRAPQLAAGPHGVALVWDDNRTDGGDIFVAWADADGTAWTPGQRVNQDIAGSRQEAADVTIDAYGNTTVVWNDLRTGQAAPEIYARFISMENRYQVYLSDVRAR